MATRLERRNVVILATAQAMSMVAGITVATLSGLVGLRLAPTPALATLPISLVMVGGVLTSLPASMLMARFGRRAGFMTGAIVGGAGGGAVSMLAVQAGSFALLCVGALLLGIYQAFARFHRFAAADAASPAFRSQAISLVLAGGVAAAFLGPWNASRSTHLLSTPDAGPYLVVGLLALFAAGIHTMLKIPRAPKPEAGQARPLPLIIGQPSFVVALVTATVAYSMMTLLMTATPLAMHGEGLHLGHTATVMQWHVLGMFVPSFFTGWLIAKWGLRKMLLIGACVLFAAASVGIAGRTMVHWWVALVLLGIGWNFLFVGGSAMLATTHTSAERGKVQGFNELVILGVVAVASLLAGALEHAVGWTALNMMLLPVVLATGLLIWRLIPAAPRAAAGVS
ncbi:MAG: MFS transporter [Nitriliruptoraceae bacterium]